MGQKDKGRSAGQTDMGLKVKGRSVLSSGTGQTDMEENGTAQIKDEETKMGISKVEALPSPPGCPP